MAEQQEVVDKRYAKGKGQTNPRTTKEERDRRSEHIANFFYSNSFAFNAAKSRSYEVMIKAVGKIGPSHKVRSYHQSRLLMLEKEKEKEIDVVDDDYGVSPPTPHEIIGENVGRDHEEDDDSSYDV